MGDIDRLWQHRDLRRNNYLIERFKKNISINKNQFSHRSFAHYSRVAMFYGSITLILVMGWRRESEQTILTNNNNTKNKTQTSPNMQHVTRTHKIQLTTHLGRQRCRNGTHELKCASRFTQLGISWPHRICVKERGQFGYCGSNTNIVSIPTYLSQRTREVIAVVVHQMVFVASKLVADFLNYPADLVFGEIGAADLYTLSVG